MGYWVSSFSTLLAFACLVLSYLELHWYYSRDPEWLAWHKCWSELRYQNVASVQSNRSAIYRRTPLHKELFAELLNVWQQSTARTGTGVLHHCTGTTPVGFHYTSVWCFNGNSPFFAFLTLSTMCKNFYYSQHQPHLPLLLPLHCNLGWFGLGWTFLLQEAWPAAYQWYGTNCTHASICKYKFTERK